MVEDRQTKINNLVEALVKRDKLLRQYALWLKTSEENTIPRGKDMYHRLVGVMHALSNVDFIPGTGNENFVEVISRVQEKTGLDLGVCKHLQYNPDETSNCGIDKGLLIGSLEVCLPPNRSKCKYRKMEKEDRSYDNTFDD